jgi:hypothetical protein
MSCSLRIVSAKCNANAEVELADYSREFAAVLCWREKPPTLECRINQTEVPDNRSRQ